MGKCMSMPLFHDVHKLATVFCLAKTERFRQLLPLQWRQGTDSFSQCMEAHSGKPSLGQQFFCATCTQEKLIPYSSVRKGQWDPCHSPSKKLCPSLPCFPAFEYLRLDYGQQKGI